MLRFVKTSLLADRDIVFKSSEGIGKRNVFDAVNPDIVREFGWADYHLDVKRLVEEVTNHEYKWHFDVRKNYAVAQPSNVVYPAFSKVADFSGVSFPLPVILDAGPELFTTPRLTWSPASTYSIFRLVSVGTHPDTDPWFLCKASVTVPGTPPASDPTHWQPSTTGNTWFVHSVFRPTAPAQDVHRFFNADNVPILEASAPPLHQVNEDLVNLIAICPNWLSLIASGSNDKRAQVISGMEYWENLMWDLNSAKGIGNSARRLFFADNANFYPCLITFGSEFDPSLRDMRITQGSYQPPGDNTMDCGFAVNFHVYDSLVPNAYSRSFGIPGVDIPYSNNTPPPFDTCPGPRFIYPFSSQPSTGNWSQTFVDDLGNSFTLNLHGFITLYDWSAFVTYVPS